MAAIDLESRDPECVSQHRSAVVWLRFGNEEGRRLRRPLSQFLIGRLKKASSKHLKEKGLRDFGWQNGYGAFSVSESNVESVKERTFRRCSERNLKVRNFEPAGFAHRIL